MTFILDSGVLRPRMAGWIVLSLFGLLAMCGVSADADYYIGAGRYDITGPAAEVEMVRDPLPENSGLVFLVRSLSCYSSLNCMHM